MQVFLKPDKMCGLKSRTVHYSNKNNAPQGNFLCREFFFPQGNIGQIVSYYTLCSFEFILIFNSHLFSSSVHKSCHRNICWFFSLFLLTSVLHFYIVVLSPYEGHRQLAYSKKDEGRQCCSTTVVLDLTPVYTSNLEVSSSSPCCPSCPCPSALLLG